MAAIESALHTLAVMADREIEYKAINQSLAILQGDFHAVVNPIDPAVEKAVVDTLDSILGDEIASYFLYEVRHMKGGRHHPACQRGS